MRIMKRLTSFIMSIALVIGMIYGAATNNVVKAENVVGQDASVGESVYIGKYPQSLVNDNDLVNKLNTLEKDGNNDVEYKSVKYRFKENNWYRFDPVEWVVLSIDGDNAVLTSKLVLDKGRFIDGPGTWVHAYYQNSTIRYWLNNQFLNIAFSNEEKSEIMVSSIENSEGDSTEDKLYLPLIEELAPLETTKCGYSDYIQEIWSSYYYTRKTWSAYFGYVDAIDLTTGGRVYVFEDDAECIYGIRPCMKANIKNIPSSKEDELEEVSGQRYKLFDIGKEWADAEDYCENLGGHLVTITSQEEQNEVESILSEGTRNSYWLGGYKASNTWKWITGEGLKYTNWATKQPDNYSAEGEDALMIYRNKNPYASSWFGSWHDIYHKGTCNNETFFGLDNIGFICEWDEVENDKDKFIQTSITSKINNGYLEEFLKLYTVEEDPKEESALFSTDFFLNPSYHKYNFLKYSALAAASTYKKVDIEEYTNLKKYSTINLLKDSGFNGFNNIGKPRRVFSGKYSLNEDEPCTTKSTKDCNDHCTIYTGMQTYNGKKIVALVISGYTTSGYEWRSNFELGDFEYHQGFKKAADEVMNLLNTEYTDVMESSDVFFWITGHSRGGAITNLVAAELTEKFGEDKVMAYGFATPNVAHKSEIKDYPNIINIVNDGDFVPYVAPYEWSYRKNGQVITFDANSNSEIKKTYKKYTGLTYAGTVSTQRHELMKAFVAVGRSQKEYYKSTIVSVDLYSHMPLQYCQEGLAELANSGEGDKLKGILFMIGTCSNKDARKLTGILVGQEVSELANADVLAEDPAYYKKGFGAFLAAHHMETYLAYVNSDQCKEAINNTEHKPYLNIECKEVVSRENIIDDYPFELKVFNTVSNVKWSSSNESVAAVDEDGTVHCLSFGKATITGTCDGQTYSCQLTYKGKNSNNYIIYKGKIAMFNQKDIGDTSEAINLPDVSEFSWKSSNKKVATVTQKGVITGIKAGTVTITATRDGLKYTRKVVVKNYTLKLNKTKATVKKGKTYQIKATPTPKAKVTYKSSKKSVATVTSKGLVKAKKKGTTTITVKANGISKKVKITVK